MARIRTIKPELLDDEKTATLTNGEWRLFVSMILLADDYGNLHANSRKLAATIFWGSEAIDIQGALLHFQDLGLARLYHVRGQAYVHLTGWEKHQRVDKPGKPLCPPVSDDEGLAAIREIVATDSRASREDIAGTPVLTGTGTPTGIPTGTGTGNTTPSSASPGFVSAAIATVIPKPEPEATGAVEVREILAHYRTYHPKAIPNPRSDSKEWRCIAARLKDGHTVEDGKLAIDGYHVSPFHCGENPTGAKHLALDLIFRDSSHVTKGIELATTRAGPVLNEREMRGVRAGMSWLERTRGTGNAGR